MISGRGSRRRMFEIKTAGVEPEPVNAGKMPKTMFHAADDFFSKIFDKMTPNDILYTSQSEME